MVRLDAEKAVHFCDGLTRRDFLHAGSLTLMGLSLVDLPILKSVGAINTQKDINCIFLFLVGGPGQLDTWDMKPDAPAEIRGPYKPIPTNVSGIQISEIFPRMARHADKYAIVRSVYFSGVPLHDFGHQFMQTGRMFQGGIEYPNFGCVLSKYKGSAGDIPPNVLLPRRIGNTGGNMPHGQTAGFLGKAFDPFVLNADPSDPNFRVPDMLPPDYISAVRVSRRRTWSEMIDNSVSCFESNQEAKMMDSTFNEAYTVMTSTKARVAFQLGQEPAEVREKYGKNKFGQGVLLARRLVERGVRYVTVNMFDTVFGEITWDCHGAAPFCPITGYRELLGPMFDQAYSSLLEDLQERGLLESTLVVATGEFGRTPTINSAGGRDHWPGCWSIVMAGGGIKGGQVVGSSDAIAATPRDRPVSPPEVAATIYRALGIDLGAELPGPQGRPIPVVDRGVEPVLELF
jgi:hypothetical protein